MKKTQLITILLLVSLFCLKEISSGSYKVEYFGKNRSKRHNFPFFQLENPFEYLSQKIPQPLKSLFNHFPNIEEHTPIQLPHDIIGGVKKGIERIGDNLFNTHEKQSAESKKEEHGRLDFFGRDIIRNVKEGLDKVMGNGEESTSKGLDTDKSFFSGLKDQFQNRVKAIFPGTKWCGGGDIAKNDEDLGRFANTDKCCRTHDNCPNSILTGETKYGLKNTGLFTRSHCDCDRMFYDCLKNNKNIVSNEIGFTYFTVLGPQCFEKRTKTVPCKENQSKDECDDNGSKTEESYQWVDNPKY